jgi:hypothetical protein
VLDLWVARQDSNLQPDRYSDAIGLHRRDFVGETLVKSAAGVETGMILPHGTVPSETAFGR